MPTYLLRLDLPELGLSSAAPPRLEAPDPRVSDAVELIREVQPVVADRLRQMGGFFNRIAARTVENMEPLTFAREAVKKWNKRQMAVSAEASNLATRAVKAGDNAGAEEYARQASEALGRRFLPFRDCDQFLAQAMKLGIVELEGSGVDTTPR